MGDLLAFMQACGFAVWQVLPLNPRDRFGSPYRSVSTFAIDDGLLRDALDRAPTPAETEALPAFEEAQQYWLRDFIRYKTLSSVHGPRWIRWPARYRDRDQDALAAWDRDNADAMRRLALDQLRLRRTWAQVRGLARSHGILLLGDLPIYPAYDSADVWAHRDLFQLDDNGRPRWVAGVPPDYFAADGQRWGNPVYDWDRHRAEGYRWWNERVAGQLELVDVLRFDHFRGFEAYWRVPARERSARNGEWRPGPGMALLGSWNERYTPVPFVAEDLGFITQGVHELREELVWPGMRVFQFGFDGNPDNLHLPANYPAHVVAYTGTHDNDTTLGWYRSLEPGTRRLADETVGSDDMPWSCIESVFRSAANTAIVPMQDLLGLGGSSRMNTPGRAKGNWRWRLRSLPDERMADRVRALVEEAGRGD